MLVRYIFLFFFLIQYFLSHSQEDFRHLDFMGAGHTIKMSVKASSTEFTSAEATIDGFPISNDEQLKQASRFLAHCTFGADYSTIQMAASMGYEAWLQEQFDLPDISFHQEEINQTRNKYGFGYRLFGSTWMTNTLTTPDLLRQRMTFNLSQIMVLSGNTMMVFQRTDLHPLAAYYDFLQQNSFSNYRNLLKDIALSPQMGHFLSHYNNPKEDTLLNIHPDENFAREIMQLFSIGLWELNQDGSRKIDVMGNYISSYTNENIKEFAQVFTGLGINIDVPFGGIFFGNWTEAMGMHNEFHDTSSKVLLNNTVLPANQDGMNDIEQTIDHLSMHPNTGPFICSSLIKKFTTSNPSPQYVKDIVAVFNPFEEDNFENVIKAILLHPEARKCEATPEYTFGKLREPLLRLMNLLRAFPLSTNTFGDYWNFLRCPIFTIGQAPLQAPSVFNFFTTEYKPQGIIGQSDLVAPEFQILSAPNTIGLINDINTRSVDRIYMDDGCGIFGMFEPTFYQEDISLYKMDYSSLYLFENNEDALVNHLNILLANGLLTPFTIETITNAIKGLESFDDQIKLAIYAILISPDYAILK